MEYDRHHRQVDFDLPRRACPNVWRDAGDCVDRKSNHVTTESRAITPRRYVMALVRAKRKRPMIVTNALDEMRLADVADEFLEQFNDRQNTFRAYSTDISQFSDYLKLVECDSVYGPIVGDLTITNAANYLASLKNKFALSTIERKGDALKSLSGHISRRYGVIDRLRDLKVPRPRQRPKFKALTDKEHDDLVILLETAPVIHRAMIGLMLWAGLRVAEVKNLRLENIGRDCRTLTSVLGKGQKLRDIPLPHLAQAALCEYLKERRRYLNRETYPLFVSSRGRVQRNTETYKLHVKTIYRIVRYYCIKAGVREKAAHPHALRHTFGIRSAAHLSTILGTGRALSALKEMMGHSNINTTAIYLTHEDTELQRAMEGMC